MDGVSHVPRSNAGDLAQAALQAGPAAGRPTGAEPAALPGMPLMKKPVLDLMMPSVVSPHLRPGVAEVEALTRMAAQVDPEALVDAFSTVVLAVDRASFGADPDPLGEMIDIVAKQAAAPFYSAFVPGAQLCDVVGRIRNWMVTLLRRKEYRRTGPALTLLNSLPLNEDIIRQVKLQAVIRKLEKEPDSVGAAAKALIHRFPAVFADGAPAAPAAAAASGSKKAAPPKLFGNVGMLKLGSHKRARDASPERSGPEGRDELSRKRASPDAEPPTASTSTSPEPDAVPKRAKVRKTVHWKPDSELVAVRFFEMEGEARFKSSKNARQQEHDEGSAMHQGIDWCTPRFLDFADAFRPDFQAKMSSKRGGTMEPESEEARTQEKREARTPMAMHSADQSPESPREPPAEDAAPDPAWRPRQARETFTGAPVPAELRHKYESPAPVTPPMAGMAAPFMNPMAAAMAQMNPMMAGYQFGAGFPMNMNPAQMSEMMAKMTQANMAGMYGMNRR